MGEIENNNKGGGGEEREPKCSTTDSIHVNFAYDEKGRDDVGGLGISPEGKGGEKKR